MRLSTRNETIHPPEKMAQCFYWGPSLSGVEMSRNREFVANNTTSTPVDSLWSQFKEKCIRSINTHVPSKLTSTRFNQAWCNRDVRRLSRRKKRAYKTARTTKQSSDWSLYKKIQVDTQHARRKAHDDFISNMVGEPGTNSKKLYTYIKSKKNVMDLEYHP